MCAFTDYNIDILIKSERQIESTFVVRHVTSLFLHFDSVFRGFSILRLNRLFEIRAFFVIHTKFWKYFVILEERSFPIDNQIFSSQRIHSWLSFD